tara:strand:- start:1401 stop:2525 length:1125 start_codon:yes stop_codon:yes gene_type:complete
MAIDFVGEIQAQDSAIKEQKRRDRAELYARQDTAFQKNLSMDKMKLEAAKLNADTQYKNAVLDQTQRQFLAEDANAKAMLAIRNKNVLNSIRRTELAERQIGNQEFQFGVNFLENQRRFDKTSGQADRKLNLFEEQVGFEGDRVKLAENLNAARINQINASTELSKKQGRATDLQNTLMEFTNKEYMQGDKLRKETAQVRLDILKGNKTKEEGAREIQNMQIEAMKKLQNQPTIQSVISNFMQPVATAQTDVESMKDVSKGSAMDTFLSFVYPSSEGRAKFAAKSSAKRNLRALGKTMGSKPLMKGLGTIENIFSNPNASPNELMGASAILNTYSNILPGLKLGSANERTLQDKINRLQNISTAAQLQQAQFNQ